MSARYQVAFYDNRGVLRGLVGLTATEQLAYSRRLKDVGTFALSLPHARRLPCMSQKDALAVVYRSQPDTQQMAVEAVYLLDTQDTLGQDYAAFVVGGVTPAHLLARRIYRPEDDPLVANGYSTKGGPAATTMLDIVTEQMISPAKNPQRAFPGLRVVRGGVDTSPDYPFRRELANTTVLDLLRDIAAATQLDFWLSFDGIDVVGGYPRFAFRVGRKSADRSKAAHPDGPYTYLTPAAGNLAEPQLTLSRRDEKTVCIVLGKGANGDRLVYVEASAATSASPFNYSEGAVEASEADTLDELLAAAQTGLADNKAALTFSFKPLVGAAGAVYRRDWDLGSRVTVGAFGVELTMQIVGVTVTLTGEGESIEVEAEQVTDVDAE